MEIHKISLNDTIIRITLGNKLNLEDKSVFGQVELDHSNTEELVDIIELALTEGKKNIILDLSNVHYIDSSGLGALIQIHKTAKQQNAHFSLLNPTKTIKRVLNMTRISTFLNLTTEQEIDLLIP